MIESLFDDRSAALRQLEADKLRDGGARVDRVTYPRLDSHLRFSKPVILPNPSALLERA